jgi:hypothetical protein
MLCFSIVDNIRSISGTSLPALSRRDIPSPSNGSPNALILLMELAEENVGIHTTLAPNMAALCKA